MTRIYFKSFLWSFLLLFVVHISLAQQGKLNIKGVIFSKDSTTVVPFAYVVNKNTGHGTVADDKGSFSIYCAPTDTIMFSSLGFITRKITATDLQNMHLWKKQQGVILYEKTVNLKPVVIMPGQLTPNEKSFYERFINQPKPGPMSPISLMYYSFSKEGKQRQKLEEIYKRELFFEKAENRLSHFVKVKKIDRSKFDMRGFIMFCGLDEQTVWYGSDYDFYYKVTRCYDTYTGQPDYR